MFNVVVFVPEPMTFGITKFITPVGEDTPFTNSGIFPVPRIVGTALIYDAPKKSFCLTNIPITPLGL